MRRGYLPRAELIEIQKTINIFAALHKKGSFPLRISLVNMQNLQFPADLVTFTEEIPNENFFFCSVLYDSHSMS